MSTPSSAPSSVGPTIVPSQTISDYNTRECVRKLDSTLRQVRQSTNYSNFAMSPATPQDRVYTNPPLGTDTPVPELLTPTLITTGKPILGFLSPASLVSSLGLATSIVGLTADKTNGGQVFLNVYRNGQPAFSHFLQYFPQTSTTLAPLTPFLAFVPLFFDPSPAGSYIYQVYVNISVANTKFSLGNVLLVAMEW